MTYNRWSTVHIAHHLRAQFWRDAVYGAQMPLTPHVPEPGCFEATLTSRSVGALVLNHLQAATGHGMERLRCDIEHGGPPSLLAVLYLKGGAQVFVPDAIGTAVDGREMQVRAGQLFMLDERHAYRIWQDGPVELLVLAMPLQLLDAKAGIVPELVASRLPDSVSLQLLVQQMQLLGQWPQELSEAEAMRLSDLVAGTLQGVLETGGEEERSTDGKPPRFMLRRVRQLIARQYPDPGLGPERVARRLGISVRTLQARLALEGTSLSAELMAYRLERAHALLRGAGRGEVAVMEVSRRCGFSSPAHFSRRFRARYGSPPVGVLRSTDAGG